MKYINKYETEAEVQAALNNGELLNPYVAYITSSDTIDWNSKVKPHDYSKDYFTTQALEDGNIVWVVWGDKLSYRINGGSWTSMGSNVTINVISGDVVEYKGNNSGNLNTLTHFSASTCNVNIYGNINSLFVGDDFINDLSCHSCYFRENNKIINAENLILPATTLVERCYSTMFQKCRSLTTAPSVLPATTLAGQCYKEMFYGCTSLTTAPELPATTFVGRMCYDKMFYGCTSLTTAPELPAEILGSECYSGMFWDCSKLNYIKCLATDISASYCTDGWVAGVSSTGTFVKKAGVNWNTGNSGIPNGWTVIEE